MAVDETNQSDAEDLSEGDESDPMSEDERSHESGPVSNSTVRVDEYTWEVFMSEYGYADEISVLYPDEADDQLGLDTNEGRSRGPSGDDWDRVDFDPTAYLGHQPDDVANTLLPVAGDAADALWDRFAEYVDPQTTSVVKDIWSWEHYKWEYYYEANGSRPRDSNGDIVHHDEKDALGFDPDTLEGRLAAGNDAALELDDVVEERTVNVREEIDEDEFFSTAAGNTTVANRYDLEKTVPIEKKTHFREVERYWVNKPYAYVVIFHSEKENEKKYCMVEPYQNEIELELQEFLSGKLRTAIKYSEDGIKEKATEDGRRTVIEDETRRLLKRYDLFEATSDAASKGILETLRGLFDDDTDVDIETVGPSQLEGIEVRPEPVIIADDPDTLNEYQVEKLLYLLKRDFIGYERIDGIKHDINVEDISVDGYNSPVFVYHSGYEQIISNIFHGEAELDDFVVKLAQRSGKGISKRLPQVDATLPDGSRAQLTLGKEVSDHGTNYTIRQFKDVPFTPIDLINWNTFSLDEMALLWLAIENHKSLIFAGGTASGKTTSLNAVSLFIPSNAKIVSIEDTREVELPQRNWIASVTRPSFADDEQGDVDEFDLLEAALRQRPDYIVMGEIRGEEGRTLFQVMSTGHTTYTTFHADSVDEVLKRFTTNPIDVSKTMFTALDLVSIQTQTRVQGQKVRRNKSLTEINHYEAEQDEINVQDVYQWQAETDEYLKMGDSNILDEIQFDRGWSNEKLEEELFKREVILAYLIKNDLNTYAQVAATVQAFMNDPDTVLTLIANGHLEDSLEDLREMESVLIDVDQEKEKLVPRPEATSETYNLSMDLLEHAEESLFDEYRGTIPSGLASALGDVEAESTIEVDRADTDEFDVGGDIDDAVDEDEWELGDGSTDFAGDGDELAWLNDDVGSDTDGSDSGGIDTADASAGGDAGGSAAGDADAAMAESSLTAASTGNGARQTVESTGDESMVFPSDETDDGDLGGLFDDMGETIEELDNPGDPGRTNDDVGAAMAHQSDTSGFDPMFSDADLESIVDPESSDTGPSTDFGERLDEQLDATSEGSEDASVADLADNPDESSVAKEPPTIDTDESAVEPPGDDDSDHGQVSDQAPETDGKPESERDPGWDGDTSTDDSATEDSAVTGSPTDDHGADGPGLIFGDSSSLKTDDEDTTDDGGSLFGGRDSSDDEGSIFRSDDDGPDRTDRRTFDADEGDGDSDEDDGGTDT